MSLYDTLLLRFNMNHTNEQQQQSQHLYPSTYHHSICVGSLLVPSSDLQELSSAPPMTLNKKRRTTQIGAFLPDDPNDPKAHPYAKRKVTN